MSPLYYQKPTLCAAGKEDGLLQFNNRALAKPDLEYEMVTDDHTVNTSPQGHLDDIGTSSTAVAHFDEPMVETPREITSFNEPLRNNPILSTANTPNSAGNSPNYPPSPWQQGIGRSPDFPNNSNVYVAAHDHSSPYGPPQDQSRDHAPSPRSYQPYGTSETPRFPLRDPQEACLLRYFVEELSHWLDLCDERRHFQLVVPIRARQHPPLLYAIFALSARHLTRLPKYRTPQGILYQGQLLPKLTPHDAVEYTLKCIPALRDFHTIHEDEKLESIIATAVILRQLEEIDDEEDEQEERNQRPDSGTEAPRAKPQVNFLAIIDAVLRSPPSRTLFGRRSLIQAAYWMAVRQELYHSFTKRQAPKMILDPEYGHGASKANKIVLHTAQVAKWRWADGSEQEWLRLQKHGEVLEEEALREFQPFYERAANRSNGEIFPTIWYSSDLEVTSMQLCIIAKMVLMAENPFLGGNSSTRAQWREIENQVRQMILDLCGIGLCHPGCPPALVHAAFGMELYGDFFTDHYERQALRGVVDKFRDARAWPVQNLSKIFE
ncbi:Ff.00g108140.m01.CDS01 [Fusarium sp. VM40]|nr:Ff.00g108140.m01.CDS01 [Fusarium sp. VM40]